VIWIGTSGWQYQHWRGPFYPSKLAQRRWLEHYAGSFDTVEVNNAFYRLPEADTFAAWARRVPDGFVIAVKASRFLTHVRRLRAPAEPVARLMARARHLGDRLGPVLVQLPPNLRADLGALGETLEAFSSNGARVAVEFRHRSWFGDDCYRLLSAHDAALCWADRAGRPVTPLVRTAAWGYVRFHEGDGRPRPCYRGRALASWAARLKGFDGADVFCYFNNDTRACALRDARSFGRACDRAGLPRSRVPEEPLRVG
jgi:uncharacterized protein YecE (DUF72 family)